jgi:hypothetical protein
VRAAFLAPALAAASLVAGTGCGETTFDAQGFIDEANSKGAGLELGEPLASEREGIELFVIEIKPSSATGEVGHARGGQHSGGSMVVTEDSEAAEQEFQRCEGAVTIVCYRAANVVLAIEGDPSSAELVGLDGAIRAMASD